MALTITAKEPTNSRLVATDQAWHWYTAEGESAHVVIGKNGWEKIIDMDLSADEQAAFNKSADAVRSMNDVLKTL